MASCWECTRRMSSDEGRHCKGDFGHLFHYSCWPRGGPCPACAHEQKLERGRQNAVDQMVGGEFFTYFKKDRWGNVVAFLGPMHNQVLSVPGRSWKGQKPQEWELWKVRVVAKSQTRSGRLKYWLKGVKQIKSQFPGLSPEQAEAIRQAQMGNGLCQLHGWYTEVRDGVIRGTWAEVDGEKYLQLFYLRPSSDGSSLEEEEGYFLKARPEWEEFLTWFKTQVEELSQDDIKSIAWEENAALVENWPVSWAIEGAAKHAYRAIRRPGRTKESSDVLGSIASEFMASAGALGHLADTLEKGWMQD